VNRKALLLFAATSGIWGSSFLFVRVAVEHMPPSAVVFGRTVLGAAFLVPLAVRNRAFRGLRRAVLPIVAVSLLDMAAPTFLTAWGEEHATSVAGSSPPPTPCSPPRSGVGWSAPRLLTARGSPGSSSASQA
jgi:drug/metabolite transporter (DMT)-like permease